MQRTHRRTVAVMLALALAGPCLAHAQTYPNQPIKLIVPYPAGGSTDAIARLYAEGLSKELGRPVVVDNKPGAATNIGSDAVAKSKPDGYTVLFGGGGPTLNSVFGPKPPFDPVAALEPLSLIARVPFMLAANPKVPFSNPREMISAVNTAPGAYSVGSAQLNVYVELMKKQARVDLLHVPYKGGAQATTDAVAGQVQMVYALVPVLLPQVQAGKLKAIAVTSARHLRVAPDVQSFREAGVDYEISTWYGLMTPAATPAAINARLQQATHKVVASSAFIDKLAEIGAEAVSSTPEELRMQMHRQRITWERLAASAPELLTEQK